MPIVLTTNDVVMNPDHQWNDVEGVQYHYPNQYKNKVRTGDEFVYYRGIHRKDGRRGGAEYFGRGRIGAIRIDPETQGASRPSWFCAIEDYTPFNPPVPAKPDGVFYEQIPQNLWRNGIRELDPAAFSAILAAATVPIAATADGDIAPGTPREADSLIVPPARLVEAAGSPGGYRKSKRAKEIGDWAESAAMTFIGQHIRATTVVHRAAQRETPGWDIDYVDVAGDLHRVEVKGTVGGAFTTIDFTAGELKAAETHGDAYWLYLVAGCLTDHPQIQRIRNPAARLACGEWGLKPVLFNIRLG